MGRTIASALTLFLLCAPVGSAHAQAHFLRGDSNHDKKVDLSDGINTLGFLFLGTAQILCNDAADVNDTGDIDIADAIYTLNFLFLGGPQPAAPFPVFEADPTADELGCLGPPEDISGDITTDVTLRRNKVYRLAAATFVKAGATISIEEGTTILGKEGSSTSAGLLVIERGARIVAVGTATHPVVFTSEKAVGSRGKANWGGIIVLGNGELNVAGKEAFAEGLVDKKYGGGASVNAAESSGQISYVRIEFGGVALSIDNEVNGLSLFSVGSGTQIDHVQVKYNDDDGVEWFGGSANLKYGIVTGVTDDMIDYSFGWSGKVQFYVGHQNKDDTQTSGNGFEVDNSEPPIGTFNDLPRTNPMISNVTMVGVGDPAATKGGQGMLIRRGAAGRVYNLIVQGFRLAGFDLDDAATTENIDSGDLVVDHAVFFENGSGGTQHCQPAGSETAAQKEDDAANGFKYTSCDFIQTKMTHNVIATVSPVVKPYDLTAPDFRPQNDALTGAFDATTLDSFFEPAPYRGAVANDGDDWTQARWISYQRN